MEQIEQMQRTVVRLKKVERLEIVEMESVMERLRKMETVMATLRHTLHQMQVLTISLKTIQMQQKESPKEEKNISTTQIQFVGGAVSSPNAGLDPHQDAIILHSAFKGNLAQVIDILANRNERQRTLIRQEYKSLYSEELIARFCQELDRDVSGSLGAKMNPNLKKSLRDAIVLWMLDAPRRDATIVGQALTSWTIDLKAITEVICSRTPSELQQFKLAYFEMYHKKHGTVLDNDISSKTGGDHRRLLLACLNTARDEGMIVDAKQAEADAVKLYKDGEARWGTDEKTFIRIFTERNRAHLVAVASCYKRLYGNTLAKAVKNETSGNFMYGLLTLLRCAENPPKYFAKVLHKAIIGSGASDAAALTRVLVTRAEVDMVYIKEEYMKKYKRSLRDAIQSATTGDHRAFLLYVVGPDDLVELQQLIAMEDN